VILVTGATGTTGGELVRLLVEVGAPARALVRSPEKAASIQRLGVETALGDFEQPDTLDAAMAGCDHVFCCRRPAPPARAGTQRDRCGQAGRGWRAASRGLRSSNSVSAISAVRKRL